MGRAEAQEAKEGERPGDVVAGGRPSPRSRPSPQRLFAAAIDLVSNGESGPFKRTARRYSLCAEDAEDAYQRALEILITKAPTDDPEQLRPWLQTVIKHEALAVRRQRERQLPAGEHPVLELAETARAPEEEAAERERAARTGQALAELKLSEVQCMLLKALGYSYDEIAQRTGFSWTKVNRSLTEGRRRFLDRFDQIETGHHCRRFEPLLSAVSDGEATDEQTRSLQRHLRSCTSCRALLRGYRAAPARVAELIPPALVLPALQKASSWSRVHDWLAATVGERAGALGFKLQQAGEMVSAQKAAAVVASSAAIAGGGAAIEKHVAEPERAPTRSETVAERRAPDTTPTPQPAPAEPPTPAEQPARPPSPEPEREAPRPAPAGEFGPESPQPVAAADPVDERAARSQAGGSAAGLVGFESRDSGAGKAASSGGEFGP
jgi:RNA polymerase sigma factor (sigma-70 family)